MPRARSRSSGSDRARAASRAARRRRAPPAPDRRDAGRRRAAPRRAGPTPGQAAHRERCEERGLAARRHDGDAARLAPIGRDLADDLRRGDAERAGERGRCAHRRAHRLRDGACAARSRRRRAEVEVALVEPGSLDARHDLARRRPDGVASTGGRARAAAGRRRPPGSVGAPRPRSSRSGCRSGARRSSRSRRRRGSSGRRRRRAALDRRRRILQLLDRGEERVEIEVREDRHAAKATVPHVIVDPPPPPPRPPAIEQPGAVRGVLRRRQRRRGAAGRVGWWSRPTAASSATVRCEGAGLHVQVALPVGRDDGPRRDVDRARPPLGRDRCRTSSGSRARLSRAFARRLLDAVLARRLRWLGRGFPRYDAASTSRT